MIDNAGGIRLAGATILDGIRVCKTLPQFIIHRWRALQSLSPELIVRKIKLSSHQVIFQILMEYLSAFFIAHSLIHEDVKQRSSSKIDEHQYSLLHILLREKILKLLVRYG